MHALKIAPFSTIDLARARFWRPRTVIAHDKNTSNQHNFVLDILSLTPEITQTLVKCHQNPFKLIN